MLRASASAANHNQHPAISLVSCRNNPLAHLLSEYTAPPPGQPPQNKAQQPRHPAHLSKQWWQRAAARGQTQSHPCGAACRRWCGTLQTGGPAWGGAWSGRWRGSQALRACEVERTRHSCTIGLACRRGGGPSLLLLIPPLPLPWHAQHSSSCHLSAPLSIGAGAHLSDARLPCSLPPPVSSCISLDSKLLVRPFCRAAQQQSSTPVNDRTAGKPASRLN